ncbi:hypothetical protein ATK17_3899 [Branchiibius hedensis]|uniref:Uncharacterized protein n=1 Tax=Branchiibius hedensis TaxID=672460 RepID=A0A2Y9BND1_9MICO|nr:hypothetical protein [Branchiibius hedensis]PWJ23008.1 hypothetical protein ATK17_3899 [Branchiibius hedensis]SSA59084.1 hypothetical protein SAMN04489750_3899 [Branchiibius hedensis]
MSIQHSNTYIVKVTDTDEDGSEEVWFVGPLGADEADQMADALECDPNVGHLGPFRRRRECCVEDLYSANNCRTVQP